MGDANVVQHRLPDRRRRRNLVAIRVRDATREALQSAADANQRSLSEECELRLDAALDVGTLVDTIERLRIEVASLAAQVARLAAG